MGVSSPDLGVQVAGTHCVLPRVGGSSGSVTERGAGGDLRYVGSHVGPLAP